MKSTASDISNAFLLAVFAGVAVGFALTTNPWIISGVALYVYVMAIVLIELDRRK